eukprot:COSAG02_NODE_14202_length_1298_cov_1.042535_2_plen_107_part_01
MGRRALWALSSHVAPSYKRRRGDASTTAAASAAATAGDDSKVIDATGRERLLVREIVEGKPALLCVDIQGADSEEPQLDGPARDSIPSMGNKTQRRINSRQLITKAR